MVRESILINSKKSGNVILRRKSDRHCSNNNDKNTDYSLWSEFFIEEPGAK
jgi:hypothetical protein